MKKLFYGQKKTLAIMLVLMMIMIGGSLLLSGYLRDKYSVSIDLCSGDDSLIHFHPTLNQHGSFLNMRLDIAYVKPLFLTLIIFGFLLAVLYAIYFLYLKQLYQAKWFVMLSPTFMLTVCLARFVERLLWDYTFNFIAIKGIGILDMIDIFIIVALVGLIYSAVCFQQYEQNKIRGMSKEEKKQYAAHVRKEFLRLFKEALIKAKISSGAKHMVSWKKTTGGIRKWCSRV